MQMVCTMNANAYLPVLTYQLNSRCSQMTNETILEMSQNTIVYASS
jgi:hypothetical protein